MVSYCKGSYRQILERALTQGYVFVDYNTIDFASGKKQIILRHDIDLSPVMALEMAEIDASYGIKSTFAVLLSSPFYNPFTAVNRDAIEKIHALGCNIVLHHYVRKELNEDEIKQNVLKEICLLKIFFPYVLSVFIWHNPSENQLLGHVHIPNHLNAYSDKFIKEMYYVSDSVTRTSPEEFLNIMGKHEKIHVLIHPVIWMSEKENMTSMISYALVKMLKGCIEEEVCQNRAWKKKFPEGVPRKILDNLEQMLNKGDVL